MNLQVISGIITSITESAALRDSGIVLAILLLFAPFFKNAITLSLTKLFERILCDVLPKSSYQQRTSLLVRIGLGRRIPQLPQVGK